MSSFICTPKHYNSIEANLHSLIYNDNFYVPYKLRNVCKKWYDKRSYLIEDIEREISDLINTIRELNVVCVSLQYKDHYKGKLDNEIREQLTIIRAKTETKALSTHGLYNALRCTRYQIEVEHLKELRQLSTEENNALFFIEEMTNALAHYIVNNLPEDKTNAWAID